MHYTPSSHIIVALSLFISMVSAVDPPGDLPGWATDPTMGGKYTLAACGLNSDKGEGFTQRRNKAVSKARDGLTQIICTKAEAIAKSWTRDGSTIVVQDDRGLAVKSLVDAVNLAADSLIQKTVQRAFFQNPQSGTQYVWIYIDPVAIPQLVTEIKAKAREAVEKTVHFPKAGDADASFQDLNLIVDSAFSAKGKDDQSKRNEPEKAAEEPPAVIGAPPTK